MMNNSKLQFSEYTQNISRSESFGKFVLIVKHTKYMANFYKINFLKHGLYEKVSILKIVHTFIEKFSLAHVAY